MKRYLQVFAAILAGLFLVSGTCRAQSPPKPKLVATKAMVARGLGGRDDDQEGACGFQRRHCEVADG